MSILRSDDFVAMHPNAVHDAECEHDHERERAAVTNQRQRDTGDRQHRDSHADVLENVGENERSDSNNEKQAELVASKKRHEKTGQQKQGKCDDKKHAANKAPLLADCGEDVIVVNGGGGKKTQLDLGVWRLETFSGPAAGPDGDE